MKGVETWIVTKGVNEQRRPAPEARLLYEESEHHREQREAVSEERRLHGVNVKVHKPDKRQRRLIDQFNSSGNAPRCEKAAFVVRLMVVGWF